MIRDNCRDKFTYADFSFIADSLAKDSKNKAALTTLLTDADSRDEILDDDQLFQTIIRKTGLSKISPYLYFYILTRKSFLQHDIDDRNMSDYVASLLAEFCSANRVHSVSHHHTKAYHYLVDMMQDSVDASPHEAFMIRSHLGNYALFMTGIFPDYIFNKSTYGRKAPDFDYYEKMGSSSYRWASQHQLALKYSLAEILANLADSFRQVRVALNTLTDNYISLDTRPDKLDKMLRQLFFGSQDKQFDA